MTTKLRTNEQLELVFLKLKKNKSLSLQHCHKVILQLRSINVIALKNL